MTVSGEYAAIRVPITTVVGKRIRSLGDKAVIARLAGQRGFRVEDDVAVARDSRGERRRRAATRRKNVKTNRRAMGG